MSAYRRVATSEQSTDAAGATARSPPSRSARISDKLHALAWVTVAYGVASYSRLFHTIFTDERILRPILHASLALFATNVLLTIYLTVWLPYKFPTTEKYKTPASSPKFWEVYCPRVIPTMTTCGIVGAFLLVRACYPVYGFLTPLILGVVSLGAFFSLHFIPWC